MITLLPESNTAITGYCAPNLWLKFHVVVAPDDGIVRDA
jgi:hypothetical protein